jgi:hypothetical protein
MTLNYIRLRKRVYLAVLSSSGHLLGNLKSTKNAKVVPAIGDFGRPYAALALATAVVHVLLIY